MKKFLVMALFLAAASGAFAYLYDGMITNESNNPIGVANALHARGGFYYQDLLNKNFDAEGESQEDFAEGVDGSSYRMFIPIDIGYNYNNVAQLDLGLQLLNWSYDSGAAGVDAESEFGISDLWIKAKGIFKVGPEWYAGPRLGVKVPVGDIEKSLGDDQMDIDIAGWVAKSREGNNFRGNAAIGFRYRLKRTETVGTVDVEYTPGMVIYANLKPGFAITPKFEAYGIIDFATAMKAKDNDGESIENSEAMGLAVGVQPTYLIDEKNAVSAELQFPVMGDNTDQEMLIGINYDAYIVF